VGNGRRALRRISWVLSLLLFIACGGGSGPTAPSTARPTPLPAPSFSLAGNWSGTIAYSGPAPTSDPASAEIRQQGAVIDAAIQARRFTGRFHGTLAGNRLDGSLTTIIDFVPYGATASGTASATAIHLASGELHFQNQVISGETIDLSR
jgi:hypothetical protein